MKVRTLTLRHFRNYRQADLVFGEGLHLVFGANAQGKSNLLEALHLALTGRPARAGRDVDLIAFGAEMARVRVGLERERAGRLEEVDLVLLREGERALRRLRVNGVPGTRRALSGRVGSVLAAPEDLAVVTGPPALRRRFLDAALVQLSPAYHDLLARYLRVVEQRNRLLRTGRFEGVEPWDAQLVDLGARLTARRRAYVERLAPRAAAWYAVLAGRGEPLRVEYAPAWAGSEEALPGVAEAALRAVRRAEVARRVTLTGPHRDDLRLAVAGCDLRTFGSRGQQRAAALALRVAEYEVAREEWGEAPILLLDDVVAELDPTRRDRLLGALGEGQAILALTTVGARALDRPVRLYQVEAGTVREVACLPLFETS